MDWFKNKGEKIKNDMMFKWAQIPFAILVVLTAGACYNLFAYFQQIGASQGYGKDTMTVIKYTVLFGYYLGIIPGYIVRALSTFLAFLVAGVLAFVSFTVLGLITQYGDGGTIAWFIMVIFLFLGSMSGSIATIAGIVTPVKSFPKMASILIIVILISYYKIAPYFEFSIRSGFFENPNLMWYFTGVGAFQLLVFAASAFVIKEVELEGAVENIMKPYDRMGLLAFVLVEVILICAFFITAIIYENWFIGAIILIVFIVINFLTVAGSFGIVYSQFKAKFAKSNPLGGFRDKRKEMSFEEMLGQPKYLSLAVASMFVIGSCSTFSFNIYQVAFSFGEIDQADSLLDAMWGGDMLGRIGGGLLAYFLIDSINGYMWAILAAVISAAGFGLALLTESFGGNLLFIATLLIGFAVGLFWVLVPSIVMEDAGEKNFGLNWGLTLLLNAVGMLVLGELFDWTYEWQSGGSPQCFGSNCVWIQFITYSVLSLLAAGLCFYALGEDEKDNKK